MIQKKPLTDIQIKEWTKILEQEDAPALVDMAEAIFFMSQEILETRQAISDLSEKILEDADPESGNSPMDEDEIKEAILKIWKRV